VSSASHETKSTESTSTSTTSPRARRRASPTTGHLDPSTAPTVVMSCSNSSRAPRYDRFADQPNKHKHSCGDHLVDIERQMLIFESNVALYQRLTQLERDMQQRDLELAKMQEQLHEWHNWESHSVTWAIRAFEKKLTARRCFFESSTFAVGKCPFYLTVCVLEVADTVPEARRPIAIFIKSALNRRPQLERKTPQVGGDDDGNSTASSSMFPLRLDGSSITLVGRTTMQNATVQMGEAHMKNASQGKGLRQFCTLGKLRESFLQTDASVVVRATVRVPRVRTSSLQTLS
jgi:hypothetical protein